METNQTAEIDESGGLLQLTSKARDLMRCGHIDDPAEESIVPSLSAYLFQILQLELHKYPGQVFDLPETTTACQLDERICQLDVQDVQKLLLQLGALSLLHEYQNHRPWRVAEMLARLEQNLPSTSIPAWLKRKTLPEPDPSALLRWAGEAPSIMNSGDPRGQLNYKLRRRAIRYEWSRLSSRFRWNECSGNTLTELIEKLENLDKLAAFSLPDLRADRGLRSDILYSLGRCFSALGQNQESRKKFNEALQIASERARDRISINHEQFFTEVTDRITAGESRELVDYHHSRYAAARCLLQLAHLFWVDGSHKRAGEQVAKARLLALPSRDRVINALIDHVEAAVIRSQSIKTDDLRRSLLSQRHVRKILDEEHILKHRLLVDSELVHTLIHLGEVVEANNVLVEMERDMPKLETPSNGISASSDRHVHTWQARIKTLQAICNLREWRKKQAESSPSAYQYLLREARTAAQIAVARLQDMPEEQHDHVHALLVEAELLIELKDYLGATGKLEHASWICQQLINSPKIGESSVLTHRALLLLLRARLAGRMENIDQAHRCLDEYQQQLEAKVETEWLRRKARVIREETNWVDVFTIQLSDINLDEDRLLEKYHDRVSQYLFDVIQLALRKKNGKRPSIEQVRKILGVSRAYLYEHKLISKKQN